MQWERDFQTYNWTFGSEMEHVKFWILKHTIVLWKITCIPFDKESEEAADFLINILSLPGGEAIPLLIGHSDFNGLRYMFYIENIINQLMELGKEKGEMIK